MQPPWTRPLSRRLAVARWRFGRLPGVLQGLLWTGLSGVLFVGCNALMREMTIQLSPLQTQFLRYLMGLLVMVPLMVRHGLPYFMPRSVGGQFVRGGVHTLGLCIWFVAIPHTSLANTTAIGFTTPIFIMLGAALFLAEPMRPARWVAAGLGLAGVLIVVGPQMTDKGGWYLLLMLSSSPLFAISFLITKALTRYERSTVVVLWQSLTVTILSLPLALVDWQWPTALQWFLLLVCGLLGSTAHYCLAMSYKAADISATQPVKFLDLVWASALGWMLFGDVLSQWTVVGALVIFGSTVWLARHESRR